MLFGDTKDTCARFTGNRCSSTTIIQGQDSKYLLDLSHDTQCLIYEHRSQPGYTMKETCSENENAILFKLSDLPKRFE